MWLVGAVLLAVSTEASRSAVEGVVAHATVLFADNVRVLTTATVILAAFVALRCGARGRAGAGGDAGPWHAPRLGKDCLAV